MSQSTSHPCAEKIKNIIHHLYIAKNLPLQGQKESVKEIMKERHGFEATKQQYEKMLKDWGFNKNRKKKDYQIIAWKVKKRARKSDVYVDGKLVDRRKLQQQGYMTVTEQIEYENMTTQPPTPPGVEIYSPVAEALNQSIFRNLPILQFQSSGNNFGISIGAFDPGAMSLDLLLRKPDDDNMRWHIMTFIETVLPNSALKDEALAAGLAIDRIERLGPVEFLNLTSYWMSNNFPGGSNGAEIYKWLKTHGSFSFLTTISSMEDFTAKALLENLFRLAVEAGDTAIVKQLLRAGVNPNGHQVQHLRIPKTMDPLQFACVTGNRIMAKALLEAGSVITEASSGWNCSLLVLAIIGENQELPNSVNRGEYGSDYVTEGESDEHVEPLGDQTSFLDFIQMLLKAGAKLNMPDHASNYYDNYDRAVPRILRCGHSPLTAACKYRHLGLIKLLLKNEAGVANVKFSTLYGTSALQECLYNWDENTSNVDDCIEPFPLRRRKKGSGQTFTREGNIIEIVQDLLDAGVDVNLSTPCLYAGCSTYPRLYPRLRLPCSYFSALDLAILTEMPNLIDLILDAKTEPTGRCLEFAILSKNPLLFERLLAEGATLSVRAESAILETMGPSEIDLLLKGYSNTQVQKLAVIAAIKFDAMHLLESVLDRGEFDWKTLSDWTTSLDEVSLLKNAIVQSFEGDMKVIHRIIDDHFTGECELIPYVNSAIYEVVFRGRHPYLKFAVFNSGARNAPHSKSDKAHLNEAKRKYEALNRKLVKMKAATNTNMLCCLSTFEHHQPCNRLLITAITLGDDELIKYCLQVGADIHTRGSIVHNKAICNCLTPLTASIIAKQWKWTNYLIKEGANVNIASGLLQLTPLSAAVSQRRIDLVRLLLKLGANLFDLEAFGQATNNIEMFKLLISEVKPTSQVSNGNEFWHEVFHGAISKKSIAMVKAILDSQLLGLNTSEASETPFGDSRLRTIERSLEKAISYGTEDIVRLLLEYGADPNCSSSYFFHTPIQDAAKNESIVLTRMLLEDYKAYPDSVTRTDQQTALQTAAARGCKDIFELLLEHGANVNAPAPESGATALQYAAMAGYLGIAHVLLEAGANANAAAGAKDGRTALEGAAENGRIDMVQLLLNAGANIHADGQEQYERAVDFAMSNGHHAIKKLLEAYHG